MKYQRITIAAVFIWIGFIGAISFMESWLKFRAPGVDLATGLGIGRLIFSTLNKIEWTLVILISTGFITQKKIPRTIIIPYSFTILILLIQTFGLLPKLDYRAAMHIQDTPPPPSDLHFYYVAAEIVKVLLLFVLGFTNLIYYGKNIRKDS